VVDFGKVHKRRLYTMSLTVANTSTARNLIIRALQIRDTVMLNSPEFGIGQQTPARPITLRPRQSTVIRIGFAGLPHADEGVRTATLTIFSDATNVPGGTLTVPVRANWDPDPLPRGQ
jgi:hypothetical protein